MKIGLFGGSFNPIHWAHLALAQTAVEILGLSRLYFIPAGLSPFKSNVELASGPHRLAMTRLATRGNPRFGVLDLEVRRQGPSYTIETVRILRKRWAAEFFLIMGSDSLKTFHAWRDAKALAKEVHLAVGCRPGAPLRSRPLPGTRVILIPCPMLDLSAHQIRARVRSGLSIKYLVPDAVDRYIRRHNLYP